MPTFFNPTPEQRRALEQIAAEIPAVQQTLVRNHPRLTMADRGAHQMQVAGSLVTFSVAAALPPELDGLGIFRRPASGAAVPRIGIGRISTGLGCPHAETDADFLGLMVAFRTDEGRRVDFITINDPTSPTDTPEEFLALLKATADAAGADSPLASQARLLLSLTRHAGLRAPTIALHVTAQTRRTVHSATAYQQYWTGILRARQQLGKFTFAPIPPLPASTASPQAVAPSGRTATQFTDDWRARQQAGPLAFLLQWMPYASERTTPLEDLTAPWQTTPVTVGTVTFPRIDPDSRGARLTTLLASELGANPGNWIETTDAAAALPATRFTASRLLVYKASQAARQVLPEAAYAAFFDRGEIAPALAQELIARYEKKKAAGHWVPNVGDLTAV